MLRDGKGTLFLTVALTVFSGLVIGRDGDSQSPSRAKDQAIAIRSNAPKAVVLMRALCSAEMAYRAAAENGEFGSAADLFKRDLIDAALANALGCPEMKSGKGLWCAGTGDPLEGYSFRLNVIPSTAGGPSAFNVVGGHSVRNEAEPTSVYSFFVDQTQVIRVSDNPLVTANAASPALGSPRAPVIR
jgi:hypothetical protein